MNKVYVFLIFLLVLASSIVLAVKPVSQISEGTDVLEIRIPQAEHLKIDTAVHVNIHVFNKTSGIPIGNDSGVSCYLDLYNQTGGHLIEILELENTQDIEWEADISAENFSTTGTYSYVIWCNTTRIGGFVSAGFDVTSTGEDEIIGNMPIATIGGTIIIIILYFIVLVRMFAEREFNEHGIVKMLFYLIAFWAILIPLNILVQFLEHYAGPADVIDSIQLLHLVIVYLNYFITIYFVLWLAVQVLKKTMNHRNKLRLSKDG